MKNRVHRRKRLAAVLLSGLLVLSLSSCQQASVENAMPFYYATVYAPCSIRGYLPEIAIMDGKLYHQWYEESYDTYGGVQGVERVDVLDMEKPSEWQRVTDADEIERVNTEIRDIESYSPLYEGIGRFVVSTDEHNDFCLLDTETGTQTDLRLNLEDWRRFSTDHETCFAVLSAFAVTVDGEFVNEIRYYKLNQDYVRRARGEE